MTSFLYLGINMTPRYVLFLLLLIAGSLHGYCFFKTLNYRYKLLTALISSVLVLELISRLLIPIYKSSFPIYHFTIPILCLFYWQIYKSKNSTIVDILYPTVLTVCLLNTFFFQTLFEYPSIPFIAHSFAIVLSALLDFKRMLNYPLNIELSRTPDFWFNLGSLFFYAFTFFAIGLMNIGLWVLPDWVYDLIFFANIILYLTYGWAIFLDVRSSNK